MCYFLFLLLIVGSNLFACEVTINTQFSESTVSEWQQFNAAILNTPSCDPLLKKVCAQQPAAFYDSEQIVAQANTLLQKLEADLTSGSSDPEFALFATFNSLREKKQKSPLIGHLKKGEQDHWSWENLKEKIAHISYNSKIDDTIFSEKEEIASLGSLILVYFHKIEERKKNSSYQSGWFDDCIIV